MSSVTSATAPAPEPTSNINGKQLDLSWKMFSNIPGLILYHFKEGNIHWPSVIYFVLVHTTAVMGLFRIKDCSYETILFAQLLWPISGYGITVGAHRLWAHRTYEAHFVFRLWLLITSSICYQGSIYQWAVNHRIHHIYSETDADPHNSTRGFFYSHFGWLILKKHPARVEAQKKIDATDLWEDPLVRYQHMCDPIYPFYTVWFLPAQICHYGWGEDYWNGVLVPGALRYCCVMHFTFLVNSAAHLWGDRPYDPKQVAGENPLVNMFTGGEGWHNWHHKYPFDYACSEFGISSQWNPSKLFIDIMAAMGLVWGRKRATSSWAMSMERRRGENSDASDDAENDKDDATAGVKKGSVPLPKKVL
mmetsp:Transcript_621/g.1454  ORF Transcript_621/g.1454 Transcript_621/m.1454 type:complete len:362 (-) Transcript_621:364-1449(-)|eukprot:CAMPEP_0168245216 /NCGR_PEP_ID=MMETSP0140_2-20121125/25046_1 /TAXON_ID=44445 /ORGANISM="Pseudo-nitzschia australis, Strain 10249 10 AB" /LENGTH=361 /DNA_ID=CAMNT_0008180791 /DNA_START=102 /DNA_END=1187 /DNA_ORIENTATION=+